MSKKFKYPVRTIIHQYFFNGRFDCGSKDFICITETGSFDTLLKQVFCCQSSYIPTYGTESPL